MAGDFFIDILRLTYNQAISGKILEAFSTAAEDKREFSAVFAGGSKSAVKSLGSIVKKYMRKNNIE